MSKAHRGAGVRELPKSGRGNCIPCCISIRASDILHRSKQDAECRISYTSPKEAPRQVLLTSEKD